MEERNTTQTLTRWKAIWIGLILPRNCLVKHVFEGRIEVKGRRRRRCKKLLADLKERTGYWKLKEEAPYPTV